MKPTDQYLFTSERLGFRSWNENDLEKFATMNADSEVMRYFPKPLSREESAEFLDRLFKHFERHGYCYFATELLETGEFLGFIGLAWQNYDAPFPPATDIGWRLKKAAWGKAYATEGANRCLKFAFEELGLEEVISTCPAKNKRSERVMQKIGMNCMGEFQHPGLQDHPELQPCVWYKISKNQWLRDQ